jgi:hypothetical protein
VLTADPVGGRGVAIFWDASANSMYGYYGGGGAGDIVNQEFVNVGSGAIGNLISNPVAHNNGITTSTNFSGASGGGGGSGGNYPGSGVVGVRITSKG